MKLEFKVYSVNEESIYYKSLIKAHERTRKAFKAPIHFLNISKKLESSWIFDNEVNEYLEEGWKLDRIETVNKDNDIFLIGFLRRY